MGKKDNAIGGGPRGGRLSVGIKVEKRRKEKIERESRGEGTDEWVWGWSLKNISNPYT